jgi:hypothetical protein
MNTLPQSHRLRLPTLLITAALAVLLSAPAASAQGSDTSSGNYMLPHCESLLVATGQASRDSNRYVPGACIGIVETLIYFGLLLRPEYGICIEAGVNPRQQGVRVVVKYLKDHPEQLHKNFKELAHAALMKAWPCGRKSDEDWAK